MFARIAREIDDPLGSLRTALQVLLRNEIGNLRPQQMDLLRSAHDDTDRLGRLRRDLFFLNRSSAHIPPAPAMESISPGGLVAPVIQRVKESFGDADVQLHVEVPAHLPNIDVDVESLRQVLETLFEITLTRTPPCGDVHLAVMPYSNMRLRFVVSDTGRRMSTHQGAKIFDAALKFSRFGLSPVVAQHIVEAHNSRIVVEAGMSLGNSFAFTLPRAC